jgi:hypothetical protein
MMRRLLLVVLVYALCAQWSHSTTLPRIKLSQLFQDADLVVFVEVTRGETLGVGDDSCGAKYAARVLEAFKGSTTGETIEFGNFYGYEIGGRYILFLVKAGHSYEPMMSSNSTQMDARSEFQNRCGPKLLRSTVMHSGNGALKVHGVSKFKYQDGVLVRTRYVALPNGLSTVPAKVTEVNEFSSEVWVRLPELTTTLKALAK